MKKLTFDCPTCGAKWQTYNIKPDSLECNSCLVKARDDLIVQAYELIASAQVAGIDTSKELDSLKALSPKEYASKMN